MKSVSQVLARQHGGSVTSWRAALGAAGVRPDAPFPGLTPFERKAVERLVASRQRPAFETPALGPTAPRASARNESPLVRWARESIQHYFATWERPRLGEPPLDIAVSLTRSGPLRRASQAGQTALGQTPSAWSASWPNSAPSLDRPGPPANDLAEVDPSAPSNPDEPGPPFGPELAAHLTEERWFALPESARRVLGLLVALSREPVLDRLVRALHPRRQPGAHPLRVLVRLAFARVEHRTSAIALPSDLVVTGRAAGLDWCALAPASGRPQHPRPPTTPPERIASSEVAELLARVSQPPDSTLTGSASARNELAPPHSWPPATREALDGVASRWRHRRTVAERGLDLGSGGLIVLLEGEEDHGQVPAAATVAADLGLELFRLHAGLLQSRYIGEAERRFSAVLDHLHERGAALLITGAQDLVAPRTEVETSRDRYSNMAVNHILSELEGWPGLCFLCAPSMTALDGAMQRRIRARVAFPPLDGETRRAHLAGTWSWLERRAGPAVSAAREAALDALATLQLGGEALTRRALELGFALETGHLDGHPAALSAWVRGT